MLQLKYSISEHEVPCQHRGRLESHSAQLSSGVCWTAKGPARHPPPTVDPATWGSPVP